MNSLFLIKNYLIQISEGFTNQKWGLTNTTIIILIILIIFTSVLLYFFQKRIKGAKKDIEEQPFIKKNPKEIRDILNNALENRSKFELSFSEAHKLSSNCTLSNITKNSLELELPLNIIPKSSWKNRKVYIYFSVRGDKGGNRLYYFFSSEILSVFSKKNINYLSINFPCFLELKQRRRYFRINVTNKDFDRLIFIF